MKILFDHDFPFLLAHGGVQVQIQQTRAALERLGVVVEFVRWWDDSQQGDVLHFFGRPFTTYVELARQKGLKVVFSALHSAMGARRPWQLAAQRTVMRLAERALPGMIERLSWASYRMADACLVLTPREEELVRTMFGAPADRVRVIPNGIEDVFFNAPARPRGRWLVTTASILPVKRIVETAEAAAQAGTPYWVIGRPFSESAPYYLRFRELCRSFPDVLRYEGPIHDRARLAEVYREARGFVMLSQWESLSISALEAAACQCPLLLSDLPWARSVFGDAVRYCPRSVSSRVTASVLRQFYDDAPGLRPPARPLTWTEVGRKLCAVYESLLRPSSVPSPG